VLTYDRENCKFYIDGTEAQVVSGHFCSECHQRTTIVMDGEKEYRVGCICSDLGGISLPSIESHSSVKANCNQYRPQYPNKRNGPCEHSNTYGDYGCNLERTEFCQDGPSGLEMCDCRRCSNEGCDQTCPSFTEWGGGCKHQNSYGEHGCPECLD